MRSHLLLLAICGFAMSIVFTVQVSNIAHDRQVAAVAISYIGCILGSKIIRSIAGTDTWLTVNVYALGSAIGVLAGMHLGKWIALSDIFKRFIG